MKNYIVIIFAALAIFTALLAVALRPVRRSSDWQLSQLSETTSQKPATTEIYPQVFDTKAEKATETEPSTETTTERVFLTESTEKLTTETTGTTRHSSKLVSRIQEAVSRDRDWLSRRETTTTAAPKITPQEFRRAGVIYYNGYKFTYYSEKVLPGKGLKIPGRHSDGNFVRDVDNYICVASSDLPKGAVVDTPFGEGKVYDTGCPSGVIDIYVSW